VFLAFLTTSVPCVCIVTIAVCVTTVGWTFYRWSQIYWWRIFYSCFICIASLCSIMVIISFI